MQIAATQQEIAKKKEALEEREAVCKKEARRLEELSTELKTGRFLCIVFLLVLLPSCAPKVFYSQSVMPMPLLI